MVVGAGVVGLTSAISLAEAGLATRVVTAEPTATTTSAAAGAVWGPVLCGPADRCRDWAAVGLSVLSKLTDEPGAGVRQVSGREVSEEVDSPPEWLDLLADHRLLGADELPRRVRVRLAVHRAGGHHAGVPGVPARALRGRGRLDRDRAGQLAVRGRRSGRA